MKKTESGQALIILIFAIGLSITILTGVTLTAVTLAKNTFLTENSQTTYYAAESGAEYALLRLIRAPGSCGAKIENLIIDSSSVTISYSLAGSICTVTITGQKDTLLKKIQFQATITNSKVTYCCWKEQP